MIVVETKDGKKHRVDTLWSVAEVMKAIVDGKPIITAGGREEGFMSDQVKRVAKRR